MQINQKREKVFLRTYYIFMNSKFAVRTPSGCAASSKNSRWAWGSHSVCNCFCFTQIRISFHVRDGKSKSTFIFFDSGLSVSPPKKIRFLCFLYELTIICLDSRFHTGSLKHQCVVLYPQVLETANCDK